MNRARIAKIAVALAVVAVPTVIIFMQIGRTGTALERTLEDIGFYPVRPPSTLVAPGSIYHVSRNGKFYRLMCQADEEDINRVLVRSPSEEVVARELQNVKYTLETDQAQLINAKLDGDIVESVDYSLRDVQLLEIPLEKNREIFIKLAQRPSCRDEVAEYLDRGELVCQGQSVLRATVEFRLTAKGKNGAGAKLSADKVPAVKEALEATVNATLDFDQGRFVSGTALHYGVKVNPICVTRPADRWPRRVPRNVFDQVAYFVRLNLLGT